MNLRRVLLVTLASVVAIGCALPVVVWLVERPQVASHGSAVTVVEGRELDLWPFNQQGDLGVGSGGYLGLVKGRCVGFLGAHVDPKYIVDGKVSKDAPKYDGSSGTVIVWPNGTTFTGSGVNLAIVTPGGRRVQLGQRVSGGRPFSGVGVLSDIKDRLPKVCRDQRLEFFDLNG